MAISVLFFSASPARSDDSDIDINQAGSIWEEDNPVEYSLTGTMEFVSLISTYSKQDISDAVKKNEVKGRFAVKYGTDTTFLFTAINLNFQLSLFSDDIQEKCSYSKDTEITRNLRISSSDSEIAINELYLNYATDNARFRAGNQVFDWGTTNLISPTSYFNPGDWRELFFNMMQEEAMIGIPSISWLGTPSLSAMFFLEDYAFEIVVSPVHTPMLLPLNNGFWSVKMDNNIFSVDIEKTEAMEINPENTGIGARVSGSILGADFSVSAFHGPDKEAVLIPHSTALLPNEQITVLVRPQYSIINMAGMDFSLTRKNFALQFEAVYSPDKHILSEVDIKMPDQIRLPVEDNKSRYIAYAAGVNYFVPLYKLIKGHKGISILFFEYSQSKYFDADQSGALFPNLMACGYLDSFFKNRFTTSITAFFDKESGSYVLQPQIGYNLRNNLSFRLSYTDISGKSNNDRGMIEPIFYYYKDNDVLIWKICYAF